MASAVGVTLGRTAIFLVSYRGWSLIKKKILNRLIPLQLLLARYGSLGSFLVALTPFQPDDIIIILLGISKFAPWKFALTTFVGKFLVNLVASHSLGNASGIARSADPLYLTLIAIVSVLSVGFLLYSVTRLDWSSINGKRFPWIVNKHLSKDEGSGEATKT